MQRSSKQRGAEEVSKSMIEISEVTQQTAAGTSQAAVSVSHLASLADDLRGSVSQFRIPGTDAEPEPVAEATTAAPIAVGSVDTSALVTPVGS